MIWELTIEVPEVPSHGKWDSRSSQQDFEIVI